MNTCSLHGSYPTWMIECPNCKFTLGGASFLKEALDLVHGPRQQDYGSPLDNWNRTAKLFSAYLGIEISPEQAATLMILVKVARLATSPQHKDSLVDIAGYIGVLDLIIREKHRRELEATARKG